MSGQLLGLAVAGINLGFQSLIVKPKRSMGPFDDYVTIEELHTDAMEITDHPIEQGALISDHAYMRPPELVIKAGWSNSKTTTNPLTSIVGDAISQVTSGAPGLLVGAVRGITQPLVDGVNGLLNTSGLVKQSIGLGQGTNQINATYGKLRALQEGREPFDVFTGKRVYANMLIKSLITTTDKNTENILNITITLRAVTLVGTRLLTAAPVAAQKSPEVTEPIMLAGARALIPATKINNLSAYISLGRSFF
jgi:hypothetical protein